jgi:opacity protein-like surface antigen
MIGGAAARQKCGTRRRMMKSLLLASLLLLGLTMTVQSAQAADVRMYVRHEVNDYATWRKNYDAFKAERNKMGVIGAAVYRSVDNPNDVTVTHDFKTPDKAKAFASSTRLKEVMEKAGVKGAPQIWFTTRAAK